MNEKLDQEHKNILDAIDNLYKTCKTHWATEDALFKKGEKQMPSDHQKVKKDVAKHRRCHVDLLNKIVDMKKEVMGHINGDDVDHLHWCMDEQETDTSSLFN